MLRLSKNKKICLSLLAQRTSTLVPVASNLCTPQVGPHPCKHSRENTQSASELSQLCKTCRWLRLQWMEMSLETCSRPKMQHMTHPQNTADITNAKLQSGSLGDELRVATGLFFGASEAEASNSGADSHVALRKLCGKAT